MKTKMKRILSLLLVLCLLLTLVPTVALGEGIDIVPLGAPVFDAAGLAAEVALGTPVIELAADIVDAFPAITIPLGADITITSGPGGPFRLEQQDTERHFMVYGALTLENAILDGGSSAAAGGGVRVQNGGSFHLNGGTIRGNAWSSAGGGVDVFVGGEFVMTDGLIYNNASLGAWGGGILLAGTGTMYGGTISYNRANTSGGGIEVYFGTFTMHGGEISKNTALDGAGVAVEIGGTFTMEGGLIRENEASMMGGGVAALGASDHWAGPGVFTMNGGTISDNNATVGGGVSASNGGIVTMNNGTITRNTAEGFVGFPIAGIVGGGGVAVFNGMFGNASFIMHNGTISRNTTGGDGGGIWVANPYDLRISTAPTTIFYRNTARHAIEPPEPPPANIQFYRSSIIGDSGAFIHVLNNYDINYLPRDLDPDDYIIGLFELAYNANGGTGGPHLVGDSVDAWIREDSVHVVLAPPAANNITAPSGYIFAGWNTAADGSGTSYAVGSEIIIDGDITLFAQWTPGVNDHTVTFNLNGGVYGGNQALLVQTVPHGQNATPLSANPLRPGFIFTGWSPGLNLNNVTEDRTFTAQWRIQSPPGNGNGNGNGNGPFSQYHNSFMIGRPSGNIYPDDNIIRAEVAAVFFRLLSDEARIELWSQENPFPDVDSGDWFNNEVSTITNAGVIQGLPDGTFRPHQEITRAEAATIVARFFEAQEQAEVAFTDIAGHWAEDYINTLADFGWVEGSGDGTFRPDDLLTRAELAAIVLRMLDRVPESVDALLYERHRWPDKANPNAWYYLYLQEATHSTTFERLDSGYLAWTAILEHIDWSIFSRPDARPDDIMVSRGR